MVWGFICIYAAGCVYGLVQLFEDLFLLGDVLLSLLDDLLVCQQLLGLLLVVSALSVIVSVGSGPA